MGQELPKIPFRVRPNNRNHSKMISIVKIPMLLNQKVMTFSSLRRWRWFCVCCGSHEKRRSSVWQQIWKRRPLFRISTTHLIWSNNHSKLPNMLQLLWKDLMSKFDVMGAYYFIYRVLKEWIKTVLACLYKTIKLYSSSKGFKHLL